MLLRCLSSGHHLILSKTAGMSGEHNTGTHGHTMLDGATLLMVIYMNYFYQNCVSL